MRVFGRSPPSATSLRPALYQGLQVDPATCLLEPSSSEDGARLASLIDVMRTLVRAIPGFLIAPLMPGLLLAVVTAAKEGAPAGLWITLSAVLGYPVAAILGVPAYLVMERLRWRGLSAYLAAGPILGIGTLGYALLPAALFLVTGSGPPATSASPSGLSHGLLAEWLLLASLAGLLAAAAFWLIVRPDRPGTSAPPAPPTPSMPCPNLGGVP